MQRSCSTNTRNHNFSHKIHHNFSLGNLHHFFCQRLSRLSFSFYPCCFIYIFLLPHLVIFGNVEEVQHIHTPQNKTPKFLSDTKSATFSLSPSLSQIELVEEFCMMCHCCCCRRCFFSFLFVFFFILQFLGTRRRRRRRRCSTYCHSWS